jgi:hypothetical protein
MVIATVTANVAKLATTNASALPINNVLGGGGAITAATTALRIQRREPTSDTTARAPAPPNDDATKAP